MFDADYLLQTWIEKNTDQILLRQHLLETQSN